MRGKKTKKPPRFPDYERVNTDDVVTFGTSVFIRKDRQALIIVFPAGQELYFAPSEELKKQIKCIRCNDNGCPACDGTKGSKYNPEPY